MSPVVRSITSAATGVPQAAKRAAPAGGDAGTKAKPRGQQRIAGAAKIAEKELPTFSRQLAAMLSAGMPIVASLDTLEEQTENPAFKVVIGRVKKSIENGSAFSEALRQFPSIFNDLYANMVKGGETGGQLAETIARLAGFLEVKLEAQAQGQVRHDVSRDRIVHRPLDRHRFDHVRRACLRRHVQGLRPCVARSDSVPVESQQVLQELWHIRHPRSCGCYHRVQEMEGNAKGRLRLR